MDRVLRFKLPGYYDYVSVSQNKESPYWTVYTTEENKQYNQNYTGEISVNATNRSLALLIAMIPASR